MGEEGGKALSGNPCERDLDRVVGQPGMAVTLGDFAGKHRACGAVDVLDLPLNADDLALFKRRLGRCDQIIVERFFKAMVLRFGVVERCTVRQGDLVQDLGQVDAVRLPMVKRLTHVELVDAAHHFFNGAEAHFRHDLAKLFSDEEEVVDDMFRLAGEARAQDGVLRRHTNGAGVQMAFAHHDAACGDQRCCRKAKLIRAEQCANSNVTTGAKSTIDLNRDARPQTVQKQRLLGFGETDFPRRTCVCQ